MLFRDLVLKYSQAQVETAILRLYPEQARNCAGYQHVLRQLRVLPPKASVFRIVIENMTDEDSGKPYASVYGKSRVPEGPQKARSPEHFSEARESYAIEFVPWAEWLGMEIDPATLASNDELDVMAHCLWEMTFAGYSPVAIEEKAKRRLDDRGNWSTIKRKKVRPDP